jgi:hypothetical protein
MKESKMYTLRKTGRTLIWGSYRSQLNNTIQNFNFWTYGKNSKIKRQPIGKQRSGKEIQVMEKK